jgi:hypothetical protein
MNNGGMRWSVVGAVIRHTIPSCNLLVATWYENYMNITMTISVLFLTVCLQMGIFMNKASLLQVPALILAVLQ